MLSYKFGANIVAFVARRCLSHQNSVLKTVEPYSNIKIVSNYDLVVKPYDVLECQDSNLLRVSLTPKNNIELNEDLNFSPSININNENIEINTENYVKSISEKIVNSVNCVIEIPVKSNLKIFCNKNIAIEQLHGEIISLSSDCGNIQTKNLQSVHLNLLAKNGNIRCDGMTLAHQIDIQVFGEKVRSEFVNSID